MVHQNALVAIGMEVSVKNFVWVDSYMNCE